MRPDPSTEIRLVSLFTVPGANYWSRDPVTRLDLAPGAYDEISTAEVPGLVEALVGALPGLVEHRCSVGERGGFIRRMREGTYAPHLIEHLALELQTAIGHDLGYGRARGGDRPGEYTVVFAHRRPAVGLRAGALALEIVQRAFAGEPLGLEPALVELRALAAIPAREAPLPHVLCGIVGGSARASVHRSMLRLGIDPGAPVVALSPAYLLNAGLPYAHAEVAVVLDVEPTDVPERYRGPEPAARLASILADGVAPGGVVVVPAGAEELRERVRGAGRRVALFSRGEPIAGEPPLAATARDGRVRLRWRGAESDGGTLDTRELPEAQLAAALAVRALEEAKERRRDG